MRVAIAGAGAVGRSIAAELLENWSKVRGRFWRVQPRGVPAARLPQELVRARELAVGVERR